MNKTRIVKPSIMISNNYFVSLRKIVIPLNPAKCVFENNHFVNTNYLPASLNYRENCDIKNIFLEQPCSCDLPDFQRQRLVYCKIDDPTVELCLNASVYSLAEYRQNNCSYPTHAKNTTLENTSETSTHNNKASYIVIIIFSIVSVVLLITGIIWGILKMRKAPVGTGVPNVAYLDRFLKNGLICEADIKALHQIPHENITLLHMLGQGKFGNVFMGSIKNSADNHGTPVAVKTPKDGASEHEMEHFLKEAILLAEFKHKNILQLYGVCFKTSELYIIFELMEGGNLLRFLRNSRPNGVSTLFIYSFLIQFISLLKERQAALTPNDLIAMSLDIATGCRYLEKLHFVHRDLACRNCLVSSGHSKNRIVKIGDFGLARDVHNSDYYRMGQGGMMSVRWAPPESLLDNIFTTKTDVWAFGVLCWESGFIKFHLEIFITKKVFLYCSFHSWSTPVFRTEQF